MRIAEPPFLQAPHRTIGSIRGGRRLPSPQAIHAPHRTIFRFWGYGIRSGFFRAHGAIFALHA